MPNLYAFRLSHEILIHYLKTSNIFIYMETDSSHDQITIMDFDENRFCESSGRNML